MTINQTAPLDNYAGLQQYVTINQGNTDGANPASITPVNGNGSSPDFTAGTGATTSTAPAPSATISLAQWIFFGAVAYFFYFGGKL